MADIPSHHLIYGLCSDYVSGESLPDTDDERYRQKLARFLVEEKGYVREELERGHKIETLFAGHFVVSRIDLVVRLEGRCVMLLRYGPGSMVTRERAAIAAARVLFAEQLVPLAVVSNGEDAEVLTVRTKEIIGRGLAGIPDRATAVARLPGLDFTPFPGAESRERELRILNAFDVELCCAGQPCALPGALEG